MATNVPECVICNGAFDDREHRPRILPCSHSLCSYCVCQLIKTENKTCPFCREEFRATTEDLRFNRYVLDIAKIFAEQGISSKRDDTAKVSYVSGQKDSISYTEKQIADCRRRKTILQGAIRDNEALEDGLLQRNKEIIISMKKHLQDQGRKNKSLVTALRENSVQLQKRYDALGEGIKELEDANDRLVKATGFASVGSVTEQIDQIWNAGEERTKTENGIISTSEKYANEIIKMQCQTEKLAVISQMVFKENMDDSVYITVNSLLRMSDSLERTIELGKLLAFQDRDEVRRYARIRLESGNRICLSHLREEERLPPEVHLIKHDHILELLNSRPYQTFVELGTVDESIGRIVIKLDPEGYHPKNFLHMCAGTDGPSYVDMQVCRVLYPSKQGEVALIEKAEHVAISGVNWDKEVRTNIYRRSQYKAGMVRAWNYGDNSHNPGFVVFTKDSFSFPVFGCFGMVEEGLDVLTNGISQYADVTGIRVVNSGIILSL